MYATNAALVFAWTTLGPARSRGERACRIWQVTVHEVLVDPLRRWCKAMGHQPAALRGLDWPDRRALWNADGWTLNPVQSASQAADQRATLESWTVWRV